MERNWQRIKSLRRKYFILFLGFIPWMILCIQVSSNVFFLSACLLGYGLGLYFFILKKLFKEKCPVCGNLFFAQPGGYVLFIRCDSCGAKIGDQVSIGR